MNCERTREEIAVNRQFDAAVISHLEGCGDCRKFAKEWDAVWGLMGSMDALPVPANLRTRTLRAVSREASLEEETSMGRLTVQQVVGAVAGGMAVALLGTLVLGSRVNLTFLGTQQLVASAVIWSAMLIAAFCWVLGRYRQWGIRLDAASSVGLIATGLAVVGSLFCPGETFFDLWQTAAWAGRLNNLVGQSGGYVVFGFLYAALPVWVASWILGDRMRGALPMNAVIAAVVSVGLLAPGAYLQCASLAAGLFAMWVAGALVGAFGAILSGVTIRKWARFGLST